ncbi:acetyl-CoA carboxylase biotin carboxyl carrier protein [Mariprofundus ferrinatatus]|uniref:Biotin carboxyl carrier protein of acetyl-CoA carboxylase n=1 Tax=Mariprofundus ferrinatatus TaxID=1921087 RepID=A0A2K8L3F8_9PROT|nr:acetyl-CoA carboxylase biotin carboxyl carrier protein [Mariprofundus ferrinatatus]ATX81868.1 acetyl-CoA carboxylase biotin carboxyl carrier protein [Mariprofundus ferrinatatus]
MDISQIRKLIKLIQSSDVTEIELTEGGETIRISRQGSPVVSVAPAPVAVAAAPAAAPATAAPVAEEASPSNEHQVTSPMVGTFYAASSPDSDDFVTVGQKVKKGDTLCIIEAMKMMNEIESEYDGVVEAVLVSNASPVEYGQPIFVITPLG